DALVRGVSARRGTRAARARHAALRADEARRIERPAHGRAALRGCATAAGEFDGRRLQPRKAEEYARFYDALVAAQSVPLQRFEETRWFEACLPVEELARRGRDTLRFGPMKPV